MPDISDLRFKAIAKKKQVVAYKRNRERKNMHEKNEDYKKSEQYLGPRRRGVIDHQFHKIAMTKRSLTL